MKKLEPNSRVNFDDLTHSYLLDNELYLMGVTSLMKKHKLSADYSNIPKEVLAIAAERGSKGHKWIEEYCKFGKRGNANIIKEFKKLNLKVLENEFLISDNEMIASMIDILLEDYSIVDIKFTSQLHIPALEWQLSIYANLLEDYYGIKVPKVYALHFNKANKASLVEIQRLPREQVEELFQAEREGRIYSPVPVEQPNADKAVQKLYEVTKYIENLKERIKIAEQEHKQLQQEFLEQMEATHTKSIVTGFCRITYIPESNREGIDTKLLKEEQPQIYEQYKKYTIVKPSVRITIKQDD